MITHVPVAAVLVLNTPDDGRLRPKHVEWPCRIKTCTVLHQVGVFIWLIVTTLLVSHWYKGGEPGCWEDTHHAHTTEQSVTILRMLTVTSFEYTFRKVHVVVSLAAVTSCHLSCVVRDLSYPVIYCSHLSLCRSTLWTNQKLSRRDVDYTACCAYRNLWPGGIGVLISRAVLRKNYSAV